MAHCRLTTYAVGRSNICYDMSRPSGHMGSVYRSGWVINQDSSMSHTAAVVAAAAAAAAGRPYVTHMLTFTCSPISGSCPGAPSCRNLLLQSGWRLFFSLYFSPFFFFCASLVQFFMILSSWVMFVFVLVTANDLIVD